MREIAYFHTDHFEPYRPVPGRDPAFEMAIPDVESFARQAEALETARNASLFYKPNVAYLLSEDRVIHRAHPADLIGFLPRDDRDYALSRAFLAPLAAGGFDLQLHIHHEHYTFNDTGRDAQTKAYLEKPEGRCHDQARLELAIRLSLDVMREDAGIKLDRWFFVHGLWALNASDPHECTIVREIEILKRNGCLGDFTQPAGRIHVDSRIDEPHLVDPFPFAKGYDTAEARPSLAAGAGSEAANRFFIWASQINHKLCSIDTYSKSVQTRVKDPETFAMGHAVQSPVIDGVLYVKTHAHTMAPPYWQPEDGRPIPHADPGIQGELGLLFAAAEAAGATITFPTVTQVYDRVIAAPRPAPRDLATEARLASAPPTAQIGVTVAFRGEDGKPASPPPLLPIGPIADPAPADLSKTPDGMLVVSEIIPAAFVGAPSGAQPGRARFAGSPNDALSADDVVMVDRIACKTALMRRTMLGPDASGVTGSYASRAEAGALIQKAEAVCADLVAARFADAAAVHEIGCGLGVLTALLAARGFTALGIEQNAARAETAEAIGKAVALQNAKQTGKATYLHGQFPLAVRGDLSKSIAVLTNLLGTASPERQAQVIKGLLRYRTVVVDVQRFYDRRSEAGEIDALVKQFREVGFKPPENGSDLGADGRYMIFTPQKVGGGSPMTLPAPLAKLKHQIAVTRRKILGKRAS